MWLKNYCLEAYGLLEQIDGDQCKNLLEMIIERRKEQKIVIKHKTKIYTTSRYFALKNGRE